MKKYCYILFLFILSVTAINGIKKDEKPTIAITLKWYKAYETQSWNDVKTGMLWSFSYLGAMLSKNSFVEAILFKDSTMFDLALDKLGFNDDALEYLKLICDSIKKTEDYTRNKSIDISRFLSLTLYSSYHYYKIVGMPNSLNAFINNHQLQNPILFGVTKSMVSKGHRLIKMTNDTLLFKLGFIAEEGIGSLDDSTFKTQNYEVFDIMVNGQFRYAIYNENGILTDASLNSLSDAGKPGKCMWCHEVYVQPLFKENVAVGKMLSNEEFLFRVNFIQQKLDAYRKTLSSEIDFTKKQDHTYSELLYISFMEPSLLRLKQEFEQNNNTLNKISKLETHVYSEFPFLGNLYYRKKIDSCFSYKKINIPESIREKCVYEPNYISNIQK